ncbi:MAG: ATP-binding cassette domain-containing protein, partial [Acetobacteraceae bacterium]|nr:ATP-binding cassette domain-containing protein [Acetobacteraceae bacterium]
MAAPPDPKLLDIAGLTVAFPTDRAPAIAVRQLDMQIGEGETLAVVGESGSGKSVTAMAITRLLDQAGGRIESGTILFRDRSGVQRDLAREGPERMRGLRGSEIA